DLNGRRTCFWRQTCRDALLDLFGRPTGHPGSLPLADEPVDADAAYFSGASVGQSTTDPSVVGSASLPGKRRGDIARRAPWHLAWDLLVQSTRENARCPRTIPVSSSFFPPQTSNALFRKRRGRPMIRREMIAFALFLALASESFANPIE